MFSDLRLALRTLAKSPLFTAIAVLTLALGIGLSSSAFSLTNVLLFRTLPYPESGRLVRVFRTSPQSQSNSIAPGNALDIRAAATSFSAASLYSYDSLAFAEPDQPAVQLNALNASANFFNLLGVIPAHGRLFAPDEDQPGKGDVVGLPAYIAARIMLGRAMREMPFPGHWLAAAILAVFGIATLIASWLPAHRAAQTDPLVALQAD